MAKRSTDRQQAFVRLHQMDQLEAHIDIASNVNATRRLRCEALRSSDLPQKVKIDSQRR